MKDLDDFETNKDHFSRFLYLIVSDTLIKSASQTESKGDKIPVNLSNRF